MFDVKFWVAHIIHLNHKTSIYVQTFPDDSLQSDFAAHPKFSF